MVRAKGSITFVHRADRIDALLGLLAGRAGEDRRVSAVAGGGTRCRAAFWCARASRSRRRRGSPPGSSCTRPTAGSPPAARGGAARAAQALPALACRRRIVALVLVRGAATDPHLRHCHEPPRSPETAADRAVPQSAAGRHGGALRRRDRAAAVAQRDVAGEPRRGTRKGLSRHPGSRAVALAINSPGGSPVQSALLFRRIRQLADEKGVPVFAFAEDVAASGGYWLALAGDEIYGEEASLLGSIGVVTRELRRRTG